MKVHKIMLGPLAVNCYVIETDKKNAVAIDVGGNYSRLKDLIDQKGLNLKKILLTHGHYDHFGGVADAAEDTGAEVLIHQNDAAMLTDRKLSLSEEISPEPFKPVEKYSILNDGDEITLDELNFKVMNTPGHTKGGVCYFCQDCVFTGDTLFRLSMGRTDFPGGDLVEMRKSLLKLAAINDDLNVYPGHNETSTLAFEKRNNPYMKENPYEDLI